MATLEARLKMKAAWTPERRAAQAERALAMSPEARRRGGVKAGARQREDHARLQAKQRGLRQWADHNKRRNQAEVARLQLLNPESRAKHLAAMKAWHMERARVDPWTPEKRKLWGAFMRAVFEGRNVYWEAFRRDA